MKKPTLIKALFLLSSIGSAEPNWLCEEEASQRLGNVVKACGVGHGSDENAARLQALENAKREFNKLCTTSDDCHGHKTTTDPKRTSCQKYRDEYICHRLVTFTILEEKRTDAEQALASREERVRASKQEVLKKFGKPNAVDQIDSKTEMWTYDSNKLCVFRQCYVFFNNGLVREYSEFKPKYLDLTQ